ncbi:MAG TPA: hypothetical protein PLY70_00105 [Saprospiraceae bacterium]|nr:hypothetical protein [Saprospiraceae bacterium]HPN67899.1 hypothetical protein [Saprospiraceae bacterium]
MKQKIILSIFAALIYSNVSSQAFIRAGTVLFQFDQKTLLEQFVTVDEKTSYFIGGGMEVNLIKALGLEIGANYYKIKVDELQQSNTDFINGSILALPAVLKFKPSQLVNVGIGLMPSIFINQSSLEQFYYRKYDLSGVLKAEVFPIKMLGIEAAYNTGFLPQELIFSDQNGVTSLIKSKNKFYSLGLKLRF